MSLAGIPFGESTLAGTVSGTVAGGGPDPTPVPEIIIDPFTIEISGESHKGLINSLSIDAELGRQGTARFTLLNLSRVPQIGEPVRIIFYSDVLFAGAIDRIKMQSNNLQTYVTYNIDCTDNSYLLYRVKVKKTYTNQHPTAIASSLLANELLYDGITFGTTDPMPNIPVVEADGTSIFELLNEVCVSVGTLFTIDNDKKLNFVNTSIASAATPLTADNIEECSILLDRETYRNKQTTTVTGTPATQSEAPISITVTRINNEQLAQQEAIEGTGGAYNEFASITHPTSNNTIQLTRLADAYNKIQLGVLGSIRRSISVRTRQYGFKAGQLVTVTLPHLDITGDWIIQRISMTEESGRFLIYSLELSQTSLIRRAQELWLDVVRKGSVTILPPTTVLSGLSQSYVAPGTYYFVTPSGVTEIQVTCYGAGGGGGGGAKSEWPGYGGIVIGNGAKGGGGGLVISILATTPGEVFTLVVGTGGTGGSSQYRFQTIVDAVGQIGAAGGQTTVSRTGGTVCLAAGGDAGIGGLANARNQQSHSWPEARSGGGLFGTAITVGGAANGGAGGHGSGPNAGSSGGHGKILVEW